MERRRFEQAPLLLALGAAGAFVSWGLMDLNGETDPQTPISYLFLPVYGLVVFLVFFGMFWGGFQFFLMRDLKGRRWHSFRSLLLSGGCLAMLVYMGSCALRQTSALRTARSPQTTPSELRTLFTDLREHPVHGALLYLAENPNTPSDVLHSMASSEDLGVRVRVAGNPSTSVDDIEFLAADSDEGVRARVACNPSTPFALRQKFQSDSSELVRQMARGE